MFEGVIANVAMVTFFKSPLRPKAPTARVQTWLKMFLIQCTLRQSWSAKFPLGGEQTCFWLGDYIDKSSHATVLHVIGKMIEALLCRQ